MTARAASVALASAVALTSGCRLHHWIVPEVDARAPSTDATDARALDADGFDAVAAPDATSDIADGFDTPEVALASDAMDVAAPLDEVPAPLPAIGAPRAIAPLSTMRVATARPTLRWALGAASTGARVEIYRDRACTLAVTAFNAVGTSGAPGVDLPPGVYFWRARGRDGSRVGTAASPVWQFRVGRRDAPREAAYDTSPDFNGDGYDDLVVGAPDAVVGTMASGGVYMYPGGPAGIAATPAATLASRAGGRFGFAVRSAGDVNGDGFADLVVSAPDEDALHGAVYVFHGGASGVSASHATRLAGVAAGDYFGLGVSTAGDLDADGFADLVVGAGNARGNLGAVYVFHGSPAGLDTTPRLTIAGTVTNGRFGGSVAGGSDIDGDGRPDLVVGAAGEGSEAGGVHVLLSGPTGLAPYPGVTLPGPPRMGGSGSNFGIAVAMVGDLNNDGFVDVAAGAPYAPLDGRTEVFLGGPSWRAADGGVGPTPFVIPGPAGAGHETGFSITSPGDVDGDGYDELLIGGPGPPDVGRAFVHRGGAALSATPWSVLPPGAPGVGRLGRALNTRCDFDGDGYDDIALGAPDTGGSSGRVFVYLGTPSGPVLSRDLVPPYSGNGYFGGAIASRARPRPYAGS